MAQVWFRLVFGCFDDLMIDLMLLILRRISTHFQKTIKRGSKIRQKFKLNPIFADILWGVQCPC